MDNETICISMEIGFNSVSIEHFEYDLVPYGDKRTFLNTLLDMIENWDSDDALEFLQIQCDKIMNSKSNDLSDYIGKHNFQHIKSLKIKKDERLEWFYTIEILIERKNFYNQYNSIKEFEEKIFHSDWFDPNNDSEKKLDQNDNSEKNVSSLWSVCTDYFHVSKILDLEIGYFNLCDVKIKHN